MDQHTHLTLLKGEIEKINTAIFEDDSDGLSRYRSAVVKVFSFNDEGVIRFMIDKPAYVPTEAEDCRFPCRLRFFQKESAYYIEVLGEGIIEDCDLSYTELSRTNEGKLVANHIPASQVMVAMKIRRADCTKLIHEKESGYSFSRAWKMVSALWNKADGLMRQPLIL